MSNPLNPLNLPRTGKTDRELMRKLEIARTWLILQHPFYGCLTCHLQDRLSRDAIHGPTACTDGKTIFWNPDFLDSLTMEETRWTLAHETLHPAHGHLWRFEKFDHLTNLACDYVIAEILNGLNGLAMPPCAAAKPGVYPDKSEEQILAILKEKEKKGQNGKPQPGPGDFMQPDDGKGEDGESGSGNGNSMDEWTSHVMSAAEGQSAMEGKLPAHIERLLQERKRPKLDWRAELAAFVRNRISLRKDWSRSSRRGASAPYITPRQQKGDIERIAVIRDTSGSICGPVLAAFNGLIESLLLESGADCLLMDCDAAIAGTYEIERGQEFPDLAKGGGGTDFRPPFKEIERRMDAGESFAGIVYLTDLCGPEPDSVPAETLWLNIMDGTAKTGRTVRIESGSY